jgi:hypothetical protein
MGDLEAEERAEEKGVEAKEGQVKWGRKSNTLGS